jgi:hypothetical protein
VIPENESVIALGWSTPTAKNAAVLKILYVGDDWTAARDIIDSALSNNTIAFGRVCRGLFPGSPTQVMYSASAAHRPQPFSSELIPAGGAK